MAELVVDTTTYFARLSYASSRRHDRPVHIVRPDEDQPYSVDWLMYCGREIWFERLITQVREFARRDWANARMCVGCMKNAPEDQKPDWV